MVLCHQLRAEPLPDTAVRADAVTAHDERAVRLGYAQQLIVGAALAECDEGARRLLGSAPTC